MIHKVDHNSVVSGFQYSDTNSTTLLCNLLSTNISSFLPIPKPAPLASSPTFLTSAPKTAENLAVLGPEKLFPHLAAGRAHCPSIRCHCPLARPPGSSIQSLQTSLYVAPLPCFLFLHTFFYLHKHLCSFYLLHSRKLLRIPIIFCLLPPISV